MTPGIVKRPLCFFIDYSIARTAVPLPAEYSFSVSGNEVVAICAAAGQCLLPVQHAVLKGDHHLIQLAEQRHQFGNAQLFRIGADRTAGDAVV